MARKRNIYSQANSLFKTEVPKMPEGYYSGDKPNPNLRRFISDWRLRDSNTQDLPNTEVTTVEINRANALYNLHKYWSKKGYEGIAHYMLAFTHKGELVLDPFCGSGGVGVVALQNGRIPILIDSSPAATFITKGYITPVNGHDLLDGLSEIERIIKDILDIAYSTTCSSCGQTATIGYVVHSARFQCDKCLKFTPFSLWAQGPKRMFRGRMAPIPICPHCGDQLNTQKARRDGFAAITVSYICNHGCKPKRRYRGYVNGTWIEPDLFSLDTNTHNPQLQELAAKAPATRLDEILEPRLYKNLEKAGVAKVSDLYFQRDLAVIVAIREAIKKCSCSDEVKTILKLCLSSILWITSKQCRAQSTQVLDATYYVPHELKELNVWGSFSSKVKNAVRAKNSQIFRETRAAISTQSSTDMSAIPSNSIDYIFTDPPYGHKYQYGQLNLLWETWLELERSWYDKELVVASHRDVSWSDWKKIFTESVGEMYRVLKPGRWLTLCYHDTAEGTWQLVQDIMAEAGFVVERSSDILAIDAKQKTYNQQTGKTVNKRDLVINFRKPFVLNRESSSHEDKDTFHDIFAKIVTDILSASPGLPKDRIFDAVVSRMIQSGRMERHDFDAMLSNIAEPAGDGDDRWFLKETNEASLMEAEARIEEMAAKEIEAFIKRELEKHPENEGIHYSDIFEYYVYAIKDKPRRALMDWLVDYFYRTPEGTYRLPISDEEKKIKAEGRARGINRRVKRYLAWLGDDLSVPEKERPNDATLAEWIRHCKRSGLYEQGKFLYEKGGLNLDNLPEEAMVNVEEDYQVCVRMLARNANTDSGKKTKRGRRRKKSEADL